ncbi:MAG: hypothetical protein C0625_16950 [Arcobacter sp.]|nr:MAG: hypothetical protein C0625_16950 [Arcobacter sp.]
MTARMYLNEKKEILGINSDEELALKIGTSKDNINKWVQRDKVPDKWQLIIGQLEKSDNSLPSEMVTINLYEDVNASAGYGAYNSDVVPTKLQFDKNFLIQFFNITKFDNLDIIRVMGDSMLPLICDGEYIIVERSDLARSGDTVIANIDGELYVKRLKKIPYEKWLILESENQDYPSIKIDSLEKLEHFRIIGIVKSKIKLY